jgi:hypothetical protein
MSAKGKERADSLDIDTDSDDDYFSAPPRKFLRPVGEWCTARHLHQPLTAAAPPRPKSPSPEMVRDSESEDEHTNGTKRAKPKPQKKKKHPPPLYPDLRLKSRVGSGGRKERARSGSSKEKSQVVCVALPQALFPIG